MKTEIKAGTKVRFKKRLVIEKQYGRFEFVSYMKFEGFEMVDWIASTGSVFVNGFYYPREILTTNAL